jgi:hypothetical protein
MNSYAKRTCGHKSSATPTDTLPRFFILLLMMESLEETPTPVTGLRLAVTSKPSPDMQHQKPHAPHHEQHLTVQPHVITFSTQAGTTVTVVHWITSSFTMKNTSNQSRILWYYVRPWDFISSIALECDVVSQGDWFATFQVARIEENSTWVQALLGLMNLGLKTGPLCLMICHLVKGALFLYQSSRWPLYLNL